MTSVEVEYDPATDVPHLARLQAEVTGKTRITILLGTFVIGAFRDKTEAKGTGHQISITCTEFLL